MMVRMTRMGASSATTASGSHCALCGRVADEDAAACVTCRRLHCSLHVYPCPVCGVMLCVHCIDDHDCCPIGEKLPKYLSTPSRKFSYGVEIEVPGAHDQQAIKSSRLIAGWCHENSLEFPGAGEYQTQPLTCPADTAELVELVRGIEPRGGTISDAGGHIHVKRTKRQHAWLWLQALTALYDRDECRAMNMRHQDDRENYYCKPTECLEGKHVAVNDEHLSTIELRTFGPWWRGTADKLAPAVGWLHAMWDWFEANAPESFGQYAGQWRKDCAERGFTDPGSPTISDLVPLDWLYSMKDASRAAADAALGRAGYTGC